MTNPYIVFSRSRSAISRVADAAFGRASALHDDAKRLASECAETERLYRFGQFHLVKASDRRTAEDVERAKYAAASAAHAESDAVRRCRRLEALLGRAQNRELAAAVLAEHGPAALAEAAEEDGCIWQALPVLMRALGAAASEREESAGLGLTDTVFEYVLPQGVLRAVVHHDADPWRECEFVPAPEPEKEEAVEVINLTPHPISFYTGMDADPRTHVLYTGEAKPWLVLLPRLGGDGRPDPARVEVEWTTHGGEKFDGVDYDVPLFAPEFGKVYGLPEPDGRHVYIVSKVTADAARAEGRPLDDLRLVAHAVRDAYGRIVGCIGLSRP